MSSLIEMMGADERLSPVYVGIQRDRLMLE